MGTLYIVATPIGNLEDMTLRAIRTLREVDLIAVEDTRHTGKLLAQFGIETPMVSYHAFNERARRERLLDTLDRGNVALVADAGTPAISDPGTKLVDAALDAGHTVRAVPGASALAAAASISGLLDGPFTFAGFLPRKQAERQHLLKKLAGFGTGLVIFESPHRVRATLTELASVVAGRRFAVARELTKVYEEVVRSRFVDDQSFDDLVNERGEVVIVVEGAGEEPEIGDPGQVIAELISSGMSPSAAAREAAGLTGRSRSELYRLALEQGRRAKQREK